MDCNTCFSAFSGIFLYLLILQHGEMGLRFDSYDKRVTCIYYIKLILKPKY